MKNISVFIILLMPILAFGQAQLILEADASANDRIMGIIQNVNNSNLSATNFNIESGTLSNRVLGEISTWSNSYLPTTGYNGYFGLTGFQKGIIFRSNDVNGNIRFLTGGSSILNNTKLFIDSNGEIGVGTDNPRERLEVLGGNIYISDSNGGIIMKSANGSCFLLIMDNNGTLTTIPVSCPN